MKKYLIDDYFIPLLNENFDIVDVIETKDFDQDYDLLKNWLNQHRKEYFSPRDRLAVVHFETDYYWYGHGLCLNNMFSVWYDQDIPFHAMLLYTNHHGIRKEIDEICKKFNTADRPTVIETIVNPGNLAENYEDRSMNIDSITMPALCMMAGSPRSHRYAVYQALRHLSAQEIALTIKAK